MSPKCDDCDCSEAALGKIQCPKIALESSGEDRIVNGAEAETQPWLASIATKQRGVYFIHCGGALINRRYVL